MKGTDPMKKKTDALVVDGTLDPYIDNGTEGFVWALHGKSRDGKEILTFLIKGDRLTVFNSAARKKVIWQGQVDYKEGYFVCKVKKGRIGTRFVQKDVDPDKWVQMFFAGKPAVLRRAPPKPKP
jgi:hypothetical protein